MFDLLGVDRLNWWKFSRRLSAVLPRAAHEMVLSKDVCESVGVIGAQMTVEAPAEPEQAPARFLVHFEGNAQQVVSAVTRVNTFMQDLADREVVNASDFTDEGTDSTMPSISSLVRAARLAPAAGVATRPPHTHPAVAEPEMVHETPRAVVPVGFAVASGTSSAALAELSAPQAASET